MSDTYNKTVLDNGVRVITKVLKNFHSVALGICLTQGSRDETKQENGISHLIEHMFFKGTDTRSARDIAIEIDSLGGVINGATSREFTYYYSKFLDEHLDKVWNLLTDILKNSEFHPRHLEKERGVILEEIKSFEDAPDDQALHRLSQALFEPHPLSYPIMGDSDNVKKFSREDILKFRAKHYRADNLIIAACGNLEHKRLVDLAAASLDFPQKAPPRKKIPFPKSSPKFKRLEKKDISQVHIALGTRTIEYKSAKRYPWLILNTFLGGSMSSRLFQRVREKEGLVYQIASFLELFSDTGTFGIYLATDPSNVQKAIGYIWDEFDKLRKRGLLRGELKRTKDQLKGSLILALESSTNQMVSLLQNEMRLGKYVSPDEIIRNIEKVRESDIESLIDQYLVSKKYSISLAGPPNTPTLT